MTPLRWLLVAVAFPGVGALWLAAQTLASGPASRPVSPDELQSLRGTVRLSADEEVLRAHGRQRAESEYAEDRAAVELFGLLITRNWVDEKTGLYIRPRGCVVSAGADIEAKAYNERIAELIVEKGLPKDAAKTFERYRKSREFRQRQPDLKWVSLPGLDWAENPSADPVGPLAVGPHQVYVVSKKTVALPHGQDCLDVIRNWSPADRQRYRQEVSPAEDNPLEVVIARDGRLIDTVYASPVAAFAIAYWPEVELLVLGEGRGERGFSSYEFHDPVNQRLMWRWSPSLERTAEELRQDTPVPAPAPTSQPSPAR